MTHKLLEDYFHSIINKPRIVYVKEQPTMFDQFKIAVANAKHNFMSLWTKPVAFVEDEKHTLMEEDYWAFEMVTYEWIDECNEVHPLKHTLIIQTHETTWMEVLDRILDEMSKHYGYNIKEQVYYSVELPLNELDDRTGKPFAGYVRSLNDNILQQLLLAHPEVYETFPYHQPKNVFE
jgi:hypothetical protein